MYTLSEKLGFSKKGSDVSPAGNARIFGAELERGELISFAGNKQAVLERIRAEIDAGRPVHVRVPHKGSNHSEVIFGYRFDLDDGSYDYLLHDVGYGTDTRFDSAGQIYQLDANGDEVKNQLRPTITGIYPYEGNSGTPQPALAAAIKAVADAQKRRAGLEEAIEAWNVAKRKAATTGVEVLMVGASAPDVTACRKQTEAHDQYGALLGNGFRRIDLNKVGKLDADRTDVPPVVPAGIIAPLVYEKQDGTPHKAGASNQPPALAMDPKLHLGARPLFATWSGGPFPNITSDDRVKRNGYSCEWSFWYRFDGAELRLYGVRQDSIEPTTGNRFVTIIEARNTRGPRLRREQVLTWGGGLGQSDAWWTHATDIPGFVLVDRLDSQQNVTIGAEQYHLETGAFISYVGGATTHEPTPAVNTLADALTTATLNNNQLQQPRLVHRITLGSAISERLYNSMTNAIAARLMIQDARIPDRQPPLSGLVIFRYGPPSTP